MNMSPQTKILLYINFLLICVIYLSISVQFPNSVAKFSALSNPVDAKIVFRLGFCSRDICQKSYA